MRSSETKASNEFSIPNTTSGKLFKPTPGVFRRFLNRFVEIISKATAKTVWTLILITFFSWFSINTENVVSGFAEIITGDLSGIRTILRTPNITRIFSEAYQVAIGKDYTWLEYEKDTGKDLSKDFVYVGKHESLTRSLITIKQFAIFEEELEESCFIEVANKEKQYSEVCDEPVTSIEKEDAEEFCNKTFGAKLANYYELRGVIGVTNPVTNSKIKKQEDYHEMTSSVNPKDNGKYRVFYKITADKTFPEYIDNSSKISLYTGFRCFIRL